MNEELVASVKAIVADPAKGPALHDLLHAEANRVIEAMRDEQFAAGTAYSKDELARRVAAYEALTEDLSRAAAMVAYWSKATDDRLVAGLVARLANAMERDNGVVPWLEMFLYPALLVMYAGGLGSVIGGRDGLLAALLASPLIHEREEWKPIVLVLHSHNVIDHSIAKELPGLQRRHTPMSDHLAEVLQPWLAPLEPDQPAFEHAFDRFEYLLGLVMFDLRRAAHGSGWAPVGRLSWRGERRRGVDAEIAEEISAAGSAWPLLSAGLFGGERDRLTESAAGWISLVREVRGHQF
ncbi:MAG: hypothetical protein V4515_13005 [Chloroflexota bacterium]